MLFKRITSLIAVVAFGLIVSTFVHAQSEITEDAPLFAAVVDNQLQIYPHDGNQITVAEGGVLGFPFIRWSPDQQYLAYVAYSPENAPQLFVYSVADNTSTLLVDTIETGFPISFSTDGTRVIYAAFNEESDFQNGIYKVDLIWIAVTDDGTDDTAVSLGTIDLGVGCGGGSNIPADWVYNEETEGFGGFSLVLEESGFGGFLHSADCGGSTTRLFNPQSMEDVLVSENFGRVKLSPDRSKAVGIEFNVRMENDQVIRESRLLLVDLETLEITELPNSAEPEQLTWSADSSVVFYSAKEQTSDLYADLEAEQRTALDTATGFSYGSIPAYTSSIYRVDIASGVETQVYSGDGYAVGRMFAAEDGTLYFSLIPNLQGWIDALVTGELDYGADFIADKGYVLPTVYGLNLEDGTLVEIGADLSQFTPAF